MPGACNRGSKSYCTSSFPELSPVATYLRMHCFDTGIRWRVLHHVLSPKGSPRPTLSSSGRPLRECAGIPCVPFTGVGVGVGGPIELPGIRCSCFAFAQAYDSARLHCSRESTEATGQRQRSRTRRLRVQVLYDSPQNWHPLISCVCMQLLPCGMPPSQQPLKPKRLTLYCFNPSAVSRAFPVQKCHG